MPKSKKVKSNNKILIAIIILAVVIIGALGYLVFDKYNEVNTEESAPTNVVELTETVYLRKIGLRYPDNWSLATDNSYEPNQSIINLTSPDGSITVSFFVIEIFGHICNNPVTLVEINREDILEIPALSYVQAILKNSEEDDYVYYTGTMDSQYADSLEIGPYDCLSEGLHWVDSIKGAFNVSIKINSIEGNRAPTKDVIHSAMQTDNFQIAKQIVKSLHIKE